MTKPFAVKYNRFSGGITSELRLNQENPKFARTWNFLQTPDRLIQRMGLKELVDQPGHIIEYQLTVSGAFEQPHINLPNFLFVQENLDTSLFSADCSHTSAMFSIGTGNLEMSVEPIYFSNHIVYMRDDGTVWAFQFQDDDLLTTPIGTLTQIFAGEDFTDENGNVTGYFTNMGSYLVVYGNNSIHLWDPYGLYGDIQNNANANSNTPVFTQWMVLNDQDGSVSSYVPTPPVAAQGVTLTEVATLQARLNELGYTVAVTGFFGPETQAAVIALQNDSVIPEGGPAGWGIPGTTFASNGLNNGIFGPLTLAVLNARTASAGSLEGEYRNVITTIGSITAEANYGDYIAYATQEHDGNANVFIWNSLLNRNGFAGENVLTNVDLGQGAVQLLAVVDGTLMAVMSPASFARCISHYNRLIIYGIESHLDSLPPSRAVMLAEYHLKISAADDGNNLSRLNYINRKSQLHAGKLYFTGRLHLQHVEPNDSDEGAMSGVFSINREGNLYFELSRDNAFSEFSDEPAISFGVIDSGFAFSTDRALYITDESRDSIAGVITNIIDGEDNPYLNKTLDNIYVALHNVSATDKIEVWLREVEDVYDPDAGWQLAYDSTTSSPVGQPTTEDKFNQRIVINRMEDGQRFAQFRELQVMVKLDGKCAELISLYITGYINDINE